MTTQSLVDPDRYLGTITRVTAAHVQANFPSATALPEKRALARGVVGDFVFIDCETVKLLGRITEIFIPDVERLTLEPTLGRMPVTNPVGKISMFGSVDQLNNRIVRGLQVHPRIGDAVYIADPALFGALLAGGDSSEKLAQLELGELNAGTGIRLRLPAEKIFGRHCGVFGATGGGKSWTLATLIAQIKACGGKAVVFDPTGEFSDLPDISAHYAFDANDGGATPVHFPYRQMTEEDLFALFRPSGQSQGPKLREAIRSLKLVEALKGQQTSLVIYNSRILKKRDEPRAPFFNALNTQSKALHDPWCKFDINDLAEQLTAECVHSNGLNLPANWGGIDQQALGYCESLIARIRMLIHASELNCLFRNAGSSLTNILEKFFVSEDDDILRLSFKNVRFEHNTREILMNVIGRYVLSRARANIFRDRPIITILDEAHQFLGRIVGDDYANVRLDAFGLIAKEGRKYGLTCVLATQRPRDIPPDVLSQLGTLFVHRLTNDDDRAAVERACGDFDRGAANFVPTLAPGEAILIGPDLPAPVPIKITEPLIPPNSKGPDYKKYWGTRKSATNVNLKICDRSRKTAKPRKQVR